MSERRPGGFVPFGHSVDEKSRRDVPRGEQRPLLRPERERGVVPFDEASRGLADDELRNKRQGR